MSAPNNSLDLDLVIVAEQPFPSDRIVDLMSAIEKQTGSEVDEVSLGPFRIMFFLDTNEQILVLVRRGGILVMRKYVEIVQPLLSPFGKFVSSVKDFKTHTGFN
jgi:hypothetical protein